MKFIALSVLTTLVATSGFAAVQTKGPQGQPGESPEAREARMAWWREAKFGLFIHWGVYSVPAGTYKGKEVPKIGEWIMRNADIPVAEYRAFARQFNPVKYHPASWAQLAKSAGMRYIVITSKHHDGFALFPSAVTDWDVADATPYSKDLIGPLAEAARQNGLRFGLYYSQAQDWTHPGGAKARMKEGEGWDDAQKGSYDDYLKKIAVPQVREILTRYQPDILWWDTPVWMNQERADLFIPLLALRPGLITNNRLGGEYPGDTETPEQFVPATGFPGRDWETCMTMNDTWGYKSYDHNWKSPDDLIRKLVDIVSKGGNFLLNIGPTSEGEIPQASIDRLRTVGAWMKVNGEAIYGTTASPFHKLTWGRCSKQVAPNGGKLYLHVFDWPQDGQLEVPGLKNAITKASLLSDGQTVMAKSQNGGVVLTLPRTAPDSVASVVVLEYTGPLQVDRVLPVAQANGGIRLSAELADIHNSLNAHARLEGRGESSRITSWNNAESRISWDFLATRIGKFKVVADITGAKGGKLKLEVGEAAVIAELKAAAGGERRKIELGVVTIPALGAQTFQLRPEKAGWKGCELHNVELNPME